MLLVDLLGWWYSRGWGWAFNRLFVGHTKSIANFFSVGDLFKTLFAPFRQDAIEVRGAPISVRLQAFGENIISRFFGLLIRSVLILVGLLLILGNLFIAIVAAFIWPLLPISPAVAIMIMAAGGGV